MSSHTPARRFLSALTGSKACRYVVALLAGMMFFSPLASAKITLSPTSLTFGSQQVGTTSPAQTITATNNKDFKVAITSITVSAGFTQTNTCGTTFQKNGSCTISISFAPTTT